MIRNSCIYFQGWLIRFQCTCFIGIHIQNTYMYILGYRSLCSLVATAVQNVLDRSWTFTQLQSDLLFFDPLPEVCLASHACACGIWARTPAQTTCHKSCNLIGSPLCECVARDCHVPRARRRPYRNVCTEKK